MKHRALIGLIFLLGCATGGVASQIAVPATRAAAPTRSEYLCTEASPTTSSLTAHLNQVSGQGWELASMSPITRSSGTESFVFCFHRAL
jgi:hypothetical protein